VCGRYSITLPPEAIRQIFQTHGELPNGQPTTMRRRQTAVPLCARRRQRHRELVLITGDSRASNSTFEKRWAAVAVDLVLCELTGQISFLVRKALEAKGIWRLNGINGMNLEDLQRMPNVSRRSATALLRLYAEAEGRYADGRQRPMSHRDN
jgi:hypothetical protein